MPAVPIHDARVVIDADQPDRYGSSTSAGTSIELASTGKGMPSEIGAPWFSTMERDGGMVAASITSEADSGDGCGACLASGNLALGRPIRGDTGMAAHGSAE